MKSPYFLLGIALAILLILPQFLEDATIGRWFIPIFYYAYLGQSWNILTGYTGAISLGHSLYLGIGAYVSTYLALTFGLTPWVGMLAGGLFAGLIALIIGFLGFRFGLRGVYFVLLTIAFAEIGRLIVLHIKAVGHFSGLFIPFKPSLYNFQFRGNLPHYYISLGFVVFSMLVVRLIESSRMGRYLVAIREDEDAASSLGVNVFKYKVLAIGISGFLTALGGVLYANYIFYLHPSTTMSMALSIEIILRPIIGGMGTVLGPVVGSFLVTPLAEISRTFFAKAGYEGLHLVIYGFLLVSVVLFFPRGIIFYLKRVLPVSSDRKV